MIKLNGIRGVVLLLGAAFAIPRGIAYIPVNQLATDSQLQGLQLLDSLVPLGIWSIVWFAVAGLCIICAFIKKDFLGFSALTGMMFLWGLAYVAGWLNAVIDQTPSREWLNAATYLAPGLIIAIVSPYIPAHFKPKGGILIEHNINNSANNG